MLRPDPSFLEGSAPVMAVAEPPSLVAAWMLEGSAPWGLACPLKLTRGNRSASHMMSGASPHSTQQFTTPKRRGRGTSRAQNGQAISNASRGPRRPSWKRQEPLPMFFGPHRIRCALRAKNAIRGRPMRVPSPPTAVTALKGRIRIHGANKNAQNSKFIA